MVRLSLLLCVLSASLAACVSTPDVDLWQAEVQITSSPEGAQVIWFNPGNAEEGGGPVELGVTPLTWSASRGLLGPVESTDIVVFKPEFGRATATLTVEEIRSGEPIHVEVPQFATLVVRGTPMATFDLASSDGVAIASGEYAPAQVAELTPGRYDLTASRAGYEDGAASVTVTAGENAEVVFELSAIDGPPDGEPRMSVLPGPVHGMSEFEFYEALRGQTRNVANCIDRAMVEDPLAAGEVHVTLHLNLPFGRTESTEITQTAFDDAEAIDCIQRRLRRVTYHGVGSEGDTGTAEFVLRYHRIGP